MEPLLTSTAVIMCTHGGRVTVSPMQTKVTVQGAPVLCEPDLVGAPIIGCAQVTSGSTKQCLTVVSVLPGSTSTTVTVAGKPAYISTLSGLTDGVPPGDLTVADAGQMIAEG